MNRTTLLRPALLVLVTAFVVLLFNSGSRFAMGLMLHPMASDLGWSRSTLSATVAVFMILSASALPFAGRLVDRLGPRWVLAIGVAVSSATVASMGLVREPWQALLLYGVAFAFGSAATSVTPIGVMLTRWYPGRVGMANSVAISGMGVGQLLIISALASQLATLGWRASFVLLGLATALVLPLVLVAGRGGPAPAPAADASGTTPARDDATLARVLSRPRVWIIFLVYAICGFQDFLVATHIVAYALDQGVDSLVSGNLLAFMGLAGLVGVLISGKLNDRYGPMVPTAVCFVVRAALFTLVVINPHDQPVIIAVALLYGLTFWITAPLAVVFARGLCGLALLGTLSGMITMVHHFAGGIGAYFGAWVFDTSGSYHGALSALLAMSVLALALMPALRRHE